MGVTDIAVYEIYYCSVLLATLYKLFFWDGTSSEP